MLKKGCLAVFGVLVIGVAGLLILIQLVPFGKDYSNPPVVAEPAWDSPQTRALAQRACFDCHSNETVWPWYSRVAPVSWLVASDVQEGREHLNFSDINGTQGGDGEVDDVAEVVKEGEMPPWFYIIPHPEAKLSEAEKQQFINGLQASLPGEGQENEQEEEGDDD